MITSFDIFKSEPDGTAHWLKAARDIETAISAIEIVGASSPGRYMIRSQETENKFYLDVNSRGVATAVLHVTPS
jgi:hypothetical protein